MSHAPLLALFRTVIAVASDKDADVELVLRSICEQGAAGNPGIVLEHEAFILHIAVLVGDCTDVLRGLEALHIEDLYLACAAAKGDSSAVTLVDERGQQQALNASRKFGESGVVAEEIAQSMRHHLLFASKGAPPRIASYAGRGALDGWLRVSATRLLLSAKKSAGRECSNQDIEMAAPGSPEDTYLLDRYRKDFAAAFADALMKLEPRDRNLIRLHHIDGVGLDALAQMYKVHASTISRWVSKARDALFDDTRDQLRQRLKLSKSEFSDIMAIVRSQLDVSISRYLRDPS